MAENDGAMKRKTAASKRLISGRMKPPGKVLIDVTYPLSVMRGPAHPSSYEKDGCRVISASTRVFDALCPAMTIDRFNTLSRRAPHRAGAQLVADDHAALHHELDALHLGHVRQ